MEQSGKPSSRSRFNLFNWDWDNGGKSRSKSKSRDDRNVVRSPSHEPGERLKPNQNSELPPYRQGNPNIDSNAEQRPSAHRSAPVPPPRSVSKTSGQKLLSSREQKSVGPETTMYNVRQHQHDLEERAHNHYTPSNDAHDRHDRTPNEEPLIAQKIAVVRKVELKPSENVRKKSGVDWEAPKKIIAVTDNDLSTLRKYNQQSISSENFAGRSQKSSIQNLTALQFSSDSSEDSPLVQARISKAGRKEEERLEEKVWKKEAIGSQIKREAQRARTVGRRAGVETASAVNSHTDLQSVAKAGSRDVNQHNESRMARQEKPVGNQGATRDRGSYRPEINLDDRRLFPSRDSANFTFESAVLALIRLRRLQARLIRNRDRYVKELELFRGWNDERYLYVLDQIAKSNNQMDELEPLIASLEAFIREQQTPSRISEHEVIRYPVKSNGAYKTLNGQYETNNSDYPSMQNYSSYHQPSYDNHSDDDYIRDLREILQHSEESFSLPVDLESSRRPRETERTTRKPSQNLSKSVGRSGMKLKSFDGYNDEQEIKQIAQGNLRNDRPSSSGIAAELDNLKEKVRQLQIEKELLEQEQSQKSQNYWKDEEAKRERWEERKPDMDERRYNRGNQQSTTAVTSQTVANGRAVKLTTTDQRGHGASEGGTGNGQRGDRENESGNGSVGSGSDEVSVDDPSYQYADFSGKKEVPQTFDHGLDESLYKMQEIMSEFDAQPPKNSAAQNFEKLFYGQAYEPTRNNKFSSGHPPLPPTHKLKPRANSTTNRHRRHHTISAGDRRGLLYSANKLHDGYETDSIGNSAMSSRKSSLDDEEISYDFQIRLNSPEQICIPERYLNEEPEVQEDPVSVNRRLVKTESIRRMLAAPGPWSSDKDQKEREKVLLITPVLAREATERSRRLALQSKQRSLV